MKTTDYIGNFIYENGELSFILMPEGRIVLNNEQQKSDTDSIYKAEPKVVTNRFEYQYFIKDHLGDTRLVISQAGEVLENNSYYPFGMLIESLSQSAAEPENAYKYNGKELADDYGLDWYDYGARFYDAQIGRWHTIDPLAEERIWLTPYQYTQNNPINLIDPDGMKDSGPKNNSDFLGHELYEPSFSFNIIDPNRNRSSNLSDYFGPDHDPTMQANSAMHPNDIVIDHVTVSDWVIYDDIKVPIEQGLEYVPLV